MKERLIITVSILIAQLLTVNSYAQFREKYNGGNVANDIQGMSFINGSVGFVAFTNSIGFTQDSGLSYIHRTVNQANTNFNGYPVNLTLGFVPRGVHAFSRDSVFAYGNFTAAPCILFSANQGQTWKMVFHSAATTDIYNNIFDLKFPGNGNVGIAIHRYTIFRSTDRGQTWTAVRYSDKMAKLSFPNPTDGYVVGGNYLQTTHNGGLTWSNSNLPAGTTPSSDYNNVCFLNYARGYISENISGKFFATIDGGYNWTQQNNETVMPIKGSELHFINDSTGFMCKPFEFQVYKTTDAGKIWERCKKNSNYQYLGYGFNRMFFQASPPIAWAGGAGEYLMIATNSIPVYPDAVFKIDTSNYHPTRVVKLQNFSKPNYQFQWYKNDTLISTAYNTTYSRQYFPLVDTIKLIVFNGIDRDTSTLYQFFTAPSPTPVITSFSPGSAGPLSEIVIRGSNFSNIQGVSFGGVPSGYFQIVNSTEIRALVGATGASGEVTVTKINAAPGSMPGFIYFPLPKITSSTPMSGEIGSTVTISGENFDPVTTNNNVYFGPVKAIVLTASPTQLTVSVPFGATYVPIAVRTNNLTAFTQFPFMVIPRGTAITATASRIDIPAGIQPKDIGIGDFDLDGKTDFAVPNKANNSLYVYKNTGSNGNISFASPLIISGLEDPVRAHVVDTDGDGKYDIIVSNFTDNLSYHRNTSTAGNLSFAPKIEVHVFSSNGYESPESIASGDYDGNGKTDLCVGNIEDYKLTFHLNKPNQASSPFRGYELQTSGAEPTSVGTDDIDGDGWIDFVVGIDDDPFFIQHPGTLRILRNLNTWPTNNLAIAPAIDYDAPPKPRHLFITDMNNDSKPDIAVSDFASGRVWLYKNLSIPGTINLDAPTQIGSGTSSHSIAFGDIDGDGKPDMVVSNTGSNDVSVFKNTSSASSISFGVKITYPVGSGPEGIRLCDLDNDGRMEIITANSASNNISILSGFTAIPGSTCPQTTSKVFTVTTPATTYQWQANTGAGFVNISNGTNYAGTNTSSLTLNGITSAWYGYKFRCIIDGTNGEPYLLTFSNTWTGAVSSAWENPLNWSCGILPNAYTDVLINSGTVILNSNSSIRSLTVNPSVTMTIASGFNLNVLF